MFLTIVSVVRGNETKTRIVGSCESWAGAWDLGWSTALGVPGAKVRVLPLGFARRVENVRRIRANVRPM